MQGVRVPDVITEHWLPVLQEESLLMECPLDQFTMKAGWVPLYTPDSLTKYLPAVLLAFSGAAPPSLSAVVPPQHTGNLDREFLLMNFHQHACLVRQSLTVGGKRRQLAFCPYCGIINGNADTALSHVVSTWTCSLYVELVMSRATSMGMLSRDTWLTNVSQLWPS